MTILASASVPRINRLDQAETRRLSFTVVSLATLAAYAAFLFTTGLPTAQVAAELHVTEAQAIDLWVDHTCARYGAPELVGMRPPAQPGELTIEEILHGGDER